ncbi:MAG: hypothetical protein ACYDDF_09540 [Thermoplasmatota archaeon]
MLEPLTGPRIGIAFWVLVLAACGLAAFSGEILRTQDATYPMATLALGVAGAAVVRIVGFSIAIGQGRRAMPLLVRVLSWVLIAIPPYIVAGPNGFALTALGAIFLGDLLGALMGPENDTASGKDRPQRVGRPVLIGLFAGLSLCILAAVHLLWASTVDGGQLIDWATVAGLTGLWIRFMVLPARRGPEEGTLPPTVARAHAPTSRRMPDAGREAWAGAVDTFRREGDVAPLVALVGDFAGEGVAEEIRALFTRPGTTREQDLGAAAETFIRRLAEIEAAGRFGGAAVRIPVAQADAVTPPPKRRIFKGLKTRRAVESA